MAAIGKLKKKIPLPHQVHVYNDLKGYEETKCVRLTKKYFLGRQIYAIKPQY